MITEGICLDVVRQLHRQHVGTSSLDESPGTQTAVQPSIADGHLIRSLLPRYSLSEIEAAIRWLDIGGYLVCEPLAYGLIRAYSLTPKAVAFAERGRLEGSERQLVYQEDPYAAFVARQFEESDDSLFNYLRDDVLAPIGIKAVDGHVQNIEEFRGDILRKIRSSRFFVCILTHHTQLRDDNTWASSVWLYQETGAAVALGKKPLVLVEKGMHDHFAGELQKNYSHIYFSREAFQERFREVASRIQGDLVEHHIPPNSEKAT